MIWQIKITQTSLKRLDMEQAKGWVVGTAGRHHFYPYVEGVSTRTYTEKQLKEMDQPPFEYQGKTYDQYQASQKQREIERSIRKQKRIQIAMEALGTEEAAKDATAAKAKIRLLNREYRVFSEAANLPLQRERTKVVY